MFIEFVVIHRLIEKKEKEKDTFDHFIFLREFCLSTNPVLSL